MLGLQFLQDLSEFFLAFEGMYDGFKERAGRVRELLRQPASGFVVVASPAGWPSRRRVYFHRRLEESGDAFRRASWSTACIAEPSVRQRAACGRAAGPGPGGAR